MMDDKFYTALVVGLGYGATLVTSVLRDRHRAAVAILRHNWDVEDRERISKTTLAAIDVSVVASAAAIEASNGVDQKLLTMEQRIKKLFKNGDKLTQSDVARLLLEMKENADVLEKYAHDSVHRLNGLVAKLQNEAEFQAMEAEDRT